MAQPGVGKPRGILNQRAGAGKFHLTLHPPSADLAFYVEHYWIVAWDLRGQEPYRQEVLAHPSVHLVVERGASRIFGIATGRFIRQLAGAGQVFGVKFRPGAFHAFLHSSVTQLTDRALEFPMIFGMESTGLEEAVLSCDDDAAAIGRVESFLRSRSPERDARIATINAIVARISADRSITQVNDVAQRFNISTRSLQRLFREYVGIGPKWVIGRYRLHEAAEQLAADAVADEKNLALALGYFDQAHFISDFKASVGRTPVEYARAGESPS